jgi:hypothetical protein
MEGDMISDKSESIGAGGATRVTPGTEDFYALMGRLSVAIERILAKETIVADDPLRDELEGIIKPPNFETAKYLLSTR